MKYNILLNEMFEPEMYKTNFFSVPISIILGFGGAGPRLTPDLEEAISEIIRIKFKKVSKYL